MPGSATPARGTLHAVDIKGILTVTDPQLFHSTVRNGVGSAKAFGFGMLCLSPTSIPTNSIASTPLIINANKP